MGQQCCPSGPGDERLEAPDQPTSINSPFQAPWHGYLLHLWYHQPFELRGVGQIPSVMSHPMQPFEQFVIPDLSRYLCSGAANSDRRFACASWLQSALWRS